MPSPALRAIGWNDFFDGQRQPDDPPDAIIARVSAHHGSEVALHGDDGEFRVHVQQVDAVGPIAVGDWLLLDAADRRVRRRFERRTLLSRSAAGEEARPQVIAANVDTAFIVTSCTAEFSPSRLERYLAMVVQSGAEPVVVLSKADLADDPAGYAARVDELRPGVAVVVLDARRSDDAAALRAWCGPGRSVALLGSSGVGKSTLAATLGAGELATGATRARDGTGRHTTTSRSLHRLPSGGVLVDNPGVRELQLPEGEGGVADVFDDVLELIAACRFSDCRHAGEPGCAVRAAIAAGELDPRRLASFEKLEEERARTARRLEVRREKERALDRRHAAAKARRRRSRDDW